MPAMKISNHCHEAHCMPDLQGATKEDVIGELIACFTSSGAIDESRAPDLYGEILAREEEGTTRVRAALSAL